jgi:hypothetical protein
VKGDNTFRLCAPSYAVAKPMVSVQLECGTPPVSVNTEGVRRRLILDTGSVSILQPSISRNDVEVTNVKPYGVTGETLDIRGRQSVSFGFDGRKFEHIFGVFATYQCIRSVGNILPGRCRHSYKI